MRRGPKPINWEQLRSKAEVCGIFLFRLREGTPGLLTHIKGGVWHTKLLAELHEDELGHPEKVKQRTLAGQMSYTPVRYRVKMLAVPPTKNAIKDALAIVKRSKYWKFTPPDLPKPGIWKRINAARSIGEFREVGRRLRQTSPGIASFLSVHAKSLLQAKALPNYPKSARPRSDDKRIQFFAKVLAGLELGIAPATATKRLARLPFPYDPRRGLPTYSVIFKAELNEHRK